MNNAVLELLPKSPKIKPVISKSLRTSNKRFLAISNNRKTKLRSLTVEGGLWMSIQTEPKTLNLLKKTLSTSKALRKFGLNTPFCGAGNGLSKKDINKALVRIIECFKNHSALVNIDFPFGEMGGIENTLRIITKGVGHVAKRLINFAYGARFWHLRGRDRNRFLVNRGLRRLPLLQRMAVKTPWFNEGTLQTFDEWENSLFVYRKLKELSLDLSGDYSVSNDFLVRMTDNLQRFPCVRNLHVHLNTWKYLKIENLRKFIERISEMSSLEEVFLRIFDCQLFTNDWMRISCESLTKISTVKKLGLSFDKCHKIRNESVDLLSKCLQQLHQQLTCIKLDFSRCSNITVEGLKLLGETFRNMKELKEAHIILECCGKINIGDIEAFVEDFGEISMDLNVLHQRSRNGEKVLKRNKAPA